MLLPSPSIAASSGNRRVQVFIHPQCTNGVGHRSRRNSQANRRLFPALISRTLVATRQPGIQRLPIASFHRASRQRQARPSARLLPRHGWFHAYHFVCRTRNDTRAGTRIDVLGNGVGDASSRPLAAQRPAQERSATFSTLIQPRQRAYAFLVSQRIFQKFLDVI